MDNPKSGSTYQSTRVTLPRVRAEDGRVVVMFELVSVRDQLDRPRIEILLEADIAQTLAAEIVRNVRKIEKGQT
jgi:hypothetical protein